MIKTQTVFLLFLIGCIGVSLAAILLPGLAAIREARAQPVMLADTAGRAFVEAEHEMGVPGSLLRAVCTLESAAHFRNNVPGQGTFWCLNVVKQERIDVVAQVAGDLHVSRQAVQDDATTNIRAGADLLRQAAMHAAPEQPLPATLAGWIPALALYSHARTAATARLYIDAIFRVLRQQGIQAPEPPATRDIQRMLRARTLDGPRGSYGCREDAQVDYAGALDCILNVATFDCISTPAHAPCTYDEASRPYDYAITHLVIHDIEGTAQTALRTFQDVHSMVSSHYIVDSDGTVYQMLREKNVAFQAGNLWYNQHSIGIEHAGMNAQGYAWYNATEYLASAKLSAYLLDKYHIPLDHDHIVSHGTIPAPTLATSPNHTDPGPYWLWPYYGQLLHEQGVPYPLYSELLQTVTIRPRAGLAPAGYGGTETASNFTFFPVYNGPDTRSGLIPHIGDAGNVTDVTTNVEAAMTYAYTSKVSDPAGTGATLYQIWYGEQAPGTQPAGFAHARQAWLAVARDDVFENVGRGVIVQLGSRDGSPIAVYGRPGPLQNKYIIGDAPNGAIFLSAYAVIEDRANSYWYEINYNHRQAWVPASALATMYP